MDEAAQRLYDNANNLIPQGFGLRNKKTSPREDMSAMEEQWHFFISSTRDKAESHTQASRFWGSVDTLFGLSLIFLSASTTATALLDGVPKEVVAGIGAVSTMIAATASFLKSSDRRQVHEKTSRGFRSLMVKMMSCETEKDYEKLWAEFNREIMDEPLVPTKFVKHIKTNYSMTPELREVIGEKELSIAKMEIETSQALAEIKKAGEKKDEDDASGGGTYRSAYPSPVKEKWMSVVEIPDITPFHTNSISHKILR